MKILPLIFESKIGYRVGTSQDPSETLELRHWNFNSIIGYLGTGLYFFGDREKADKLQKKLKNNDQRGDLKIVEIDLEKYKLYRPVDPENFYETLKDITRALGQYAGKVEKIDFNSIVEELEEIYDIIKKELSLNIPREDLENIVKGFILDVHNKRPGTMLSNRLLSYLDYEGIDNTGVDGLDSYAVGSVIFKYK